MAEHNADDPTSSNKILESIEVPERQQYVNKKNEGYKGREYEWSLLLNVKKPILRQEQTKLFKLIAQETPWLEIILLL